VLLREHGEGVVAIGQASHSWMAGQLARLWNPPPAPYEEVCLAAEQHDIGMAEWDQRPALNPRTGLPYSFLELPVATAIGLWSAAPGKLLSQSRYAALLVSMHGAALSRLRDVAKLNPDERRLVTDYLAAQSELQDDLGRLIGADADELARNQRLVWAWDSLSLAMCLRWRTVSVEGSTLTETASDRFALHPWPFAAGEVLVHCEGRLLGRRYESEPPLHAALDRAPSVRLVFTLHPSGLR
jgi:Protein of unknown function (DUF3891)